MYYLQFRRGLSCIELFLGGTRWCAAQVISFFHCTWLTVVDHTLFRVCACTYFDTIAINYYLRWYLASCGGELARSFPPCSILRSLVTIFLFFLHRTCAGVENFLFLWRIDCVVSNMSAINTVGVSGLVWSSSAVSRVAVSQSPFSMDASGVRLTDGTLNSCVRKELPAPESMCIYITW